MRADLERLAAAGGASLADELRRERALAIARELRLDETLGEVAAVARQLGIELTLLKGRALVLAGHAAPGARPSVDLDLLVAGAAVEPLGGALRAAGFAPAPAGYEHHAPALLRPGGAMVELHRHLPGVRLGAGRASATWEALAEAGLLHPLGSEGPLRALAVPAREVLIAHALVHGLAQHGLHAAFPGWLLIADLLDLGAHRPETPAAPSWRDWVARELSARELDAALALARWVAAGADPFGSDAPADARELARHFVACVQDERYAKSLKARWLAAPVSDLPRPLARARLLLGTVAPPADGESAHGPLDRVRRVGRWLLRPFALVGRLARAARAGLAVRRSRRRDQTPK